MISASVPLVNPGCEKQSEVFRMDAAQFSFRTKKLNRDFNHGDAVAWPGPCARGRVGVIVYFCGGFAQVRSGRSKKWIPTRHLVRPPDQVSPAPRHRRIVAEPALN